MMTLQEVAVVRIGVRALKNGLSRYLKSVRQGETIIVTERNKPIAKLSPVKTGVPSAYEVLIHEDKVSWSCGKPQGAAVSKTGDARELSALVAEDRR
jgi:prevent-host-death family protein